MEKILRILSGLNRCAEVSISPDIPLVIGTHPDCSVILADAGVADAHCRILFNPKCANEVLCTAIDANIQINSRTLQPGEAVFISDYQVVQCGPICFAVGERSYDWKRLEKTVWDESAYIRRNGLNFWWLLSQRVRAMTSRRRGLYAALAVLGLMSSVGLVYAALSPSISATSPAYLENAQRWLKSVAPVGSELKMAREPDGQLQLSGYVATSYQNEMLAMAVKDSMYQPRMKTYVIEQMVESLSRLANLENLPCIANYLSSGRLGCNNDVPNKDQATRLQVLAQQIPGVKALELRMRSESSSVVNTNATTQDNTATVASSAKPEEQKRPAQSGFPPFSRKLNVFISKRDRYVVDTRGLKFREGDAIDGYTINTIELDQVQLQYGEQRFLLQIAAAQ